MTLRFQDLTQEQQDFVSDDCGNHFLDVPDFMWTDACREHDFGYWLGCTENDRRRVDEAWYHQMLQAVDDTDSELFKYNKWVYKLLATLYFFAVRMFSWRFFNYGNSYKTQQDLVLEMEEGHHGQI